MDFQSYFKPWCDSREREVRFINDISSIFEYHCIIMVKNCFDFLDDFDTDRNEVILINTASSLIPDDFHEDSFGNNEVNNKL